MGFADTARALGSTVLAMLHTRLELAAVELQEESQRFLGYAVMALLALFLCGVALVLAALFVVILFWDSYRLAAVGGLSLAFAAGAGLIAFRVKSSFNARPRLMAATVGELRKDVLALRGSDE